MPVDSPPTKWKRRWWWSRKRQKRIRNLTQQKACVYVNTFIFFQLMSWARASMQILQDLHIYSSQRQLVARRRLFFMGIAFHNNRFIPINIEPRNQFYYKFPSIYRVMKPLNCKFFQRSFQYYVTHPNAPTLHNPFITAHKESGSYSDWGPPLATFTYPTHYWGTYMYSYPNFQFADLLFFCWNREMLLMQLPSLRGNLINEKSVRTSLQLHLGYFLWWGTYTGRKQMVLPFVV